jgi:hypothetical protein
VAVALGVLAWMYHSRAPSVVPHGSGSEHAGPVSPAPSPAGDQPAGTAPTAAGPAGAAAPAGPPTGAKPKAQRVSFARDVQGILPVGEGDTFYRDDRKVVLWIRWENVRGQHKARTRWYNPEGTLVASSPLESIDSPADMWATWTAFRLRRGPELLPGQWRAEVQVDGATAVVAHFTLLDEPRPPAATSSAR